MRLGRFFKSFRPSAENSRILTNGIWDASQQATTMVTNATFALLLILAVPVDEYGIYSYALGLCSIGMSVMSAGLSGLAVKALVNDRDSASLTVASLLIIREFFAVIGLAVIGLISLTSGSRATVAAALLASLALLARALDAPDFWYKAEQRNRVTASIRIAVTVSLLGLRLVALVWWPNIWLMLALFVGESLVAGLLILLRYRRDSLSPGISRPKMTSIRPLLMQSTPLLLSSIANQVNLRGDIVVLQAMLGASAVGVYSAAARMSELAYFLPAVFMNAMLPLLLRVRREGGPTHPRYLRMLQSSYDKAFWAGVGIAIGIGSIGTFVIVTFLDPAYAEAKNVLWVHVIACPFVNMGAVYSKWIIAEGVLWRSLARHSCGAVSNLALNMVLIPLYGLIGSAVATVVSYVIASYLACFIGKRSRQPAHQMTLAIVAPIRYAVRTLRT